MLELEQSFPAIGVDVVVNGRTARSNRLVQNFLHGGVKLTELLAC